MYSLPTMFIWRDVPALVAALAELLRVCAIIAILAGLAIAVPFLAAELLARWRDARKRVSASVVRLDTWRVRPNDVALDRRPPADRMRQHGITRREAGNRLRWMIR